MGTKSTYTPEIGAAICEVQELVATLPSGIRVWRGVDIQPRAPWWARLMRWLA